MVDNKERYWEDDFADKIGRKDESKCFTKPPQEPATVVSTEALEVPASDEARCTANTEDLHGFGVFSYD